MAGERGAVGDDGGLGQGERDVLAEFDVLGKQMRSLGEAANDSSDGGSARRDVEVLDVLTWQSTWRGVASNTLSMVVMTVVDVDAVDDIRVNDTSTSPCPSDTATATATAVAIAVSSIV